MPQHVRADFLGFEGGTLAVGGCGVFRNEALDGIAAEGAASDAGEKRILR